MTQIKHSEWGASVSATYTYFSTICIAPAFPACSHWESISSCEYHKHKIRVFGEIPSPSKTKLDIRVRSGAHIGDWETIASDELPQTDAYGWNSTFAAAVKSDSYPGPAHNVSTQKNASRVMPFHMVNFGVYYVSDPAEPEAATIYGFELGIEHGQSYDGSDMELFDYDDGSYTTDYPASSAIVALAGIASYNDILYHACWRFSVAIAGTRV